MYSKNNTGDRAGIYRLAESVATGKSLTGCLYFVNKTPVDGYSKKKATVETATYGSEFVAAKTATEQIMDIRQTLRYFGAPIGAKSFLFGDNRSVVTSASLPPSTLTKHHIIQHFTELGKPLLQNSWLSIGSSLPTTQELCSPSIGTILQCTQ